MFTKVSTNIHAQKYFDEMEEEDFNPSHKLKLISNTSK
jgi:hypothetical protein